MKVSYDHQSVIINVKRDDTEVQELLTNSVPYIHSNRIKTEYATTIKNLKKVVDTYKGTVPHNVLIDIKKQEEIKWRTQLLLENGPQRSDAVLMEHQQLGVELAEINNRYGFFYDTRTGKTIMALKIIAEDIKRNPHHKWLIICPLILIEQAWLSDANKFFPELQIVSLHAKTKEKRLKQFEQKANVYIQNAESFVSYKDNIDKLDIHGVFVDESSTMKSYKSKFAKAAVDYSTTVKRWYLLSGTPAPNLETEYYMQLKSIDYYSVPQSYTRFENEFFDNISYNPQFKKLRLKGHKADELNDLIKQYSIYVDAEDCMKTPGRDFKCVYTDMPLELRKYYNEMKQKFSIELKEEESVDAPSAAAKIGKLRQLTSGFVYDEDGKAHFLHDYKFAALKNLLDSIGDKQVLIWANYRTEFEYIQALLGDKCAIVNGSVSSFEKNININKFKAGDIQYLVANPASMQMGVTLTNAYHCIYFSLNHSYEQYYQSIARIYGGIHSQPNFCYYYILMTRDTLDQVIWDCLKHKQDASRTLLDYLKGGYTNG